MSPSAAASVPNLQGLLLPRDRHKTLTALAATEPATGAQDAPAQHLQFFLSEADWEGEALNARRLEVLLGDPATQPHEGGAGDRRQRVPQRWHQDRSCRPSVLGQHRQDRQRHRGGASTWAFPSGPSADCFYGDNGTFEEALRSPGLPFVLGLKAGHAIWAPADALHSPEEALEELSWQGPDDPGDWTKIVRRFHDGHEETWWATELIFGPYGPDNPFRIIVATADPGTLPALSTWYLLTNLPHPDAVDAADTLVAPPDLAEVVRLYGLWNWIEQSYKQTRQELGWADFMVRDDRGIRRHWSLVCCAFSFCWQAWVTAEKADDQTPGDAAVAQRGGKSGGGRRANDRRRVLATDRPAGAQLAGPVDYALALLARVVRSAPARRPPSAP